RQGGFAPFFLMSRPPLLREEGTIRLSDQFVPTLIDQSTTSPIHNGSEPQNPSLQDAVWLFVGCTRYCAVYHGSYRVIVAGVERVKQIEFRFETKSLKIHPFAKAEVDLIDTRCQLRSWGNQGDIQRSLGHIGNY